MTFNSIRGQLGDIFILKSYSFIYESYGKESLIVMGNEYGSKTCLNIVSKLKESTDKNHEKHKLELFES